MAQKFVPRSADRCEKSVTKFISMLGSVEKLLIVSGAGISTESGIQDYRSKDVGLYTTTTHKPIYYQDFMKSKSCRQRYWSHSFLKWPRLYHAAPNINHHLLAEWETSDRFLWLITQNVDGLHVKAGSKKVTELHGNARYVKCTDCDYTESRQTFQEKLDRVNPGFADQFVIPGYIPTDGNIHLPLETEKNFNIPGCPCCGGIMLTAVTLFGDKIPNYKLEHSQQKVKECDGILTLGTSLEVYSGYQYVLQANQQKKPIFIVNIGSTRADGIATMKLDYKISDVLREM